MDTNEIQNKFEQLAALHEELDDLARIGLIHYLKATGELF